MKKLNLKHRIIETSFGEVMLKESKAPMTGEVSCDMYVGDNFDDFVGSVNCSIYDDDDVILEQINEVLYY